MNPVANKLSLLFVLILFGSIFSTLEAQRFKYSLPGLDTVETFIVAGGSSSVLKNGQGEIILNTSLTSFQQAIHQSGKDSPIVDRIRQTQFVSDLFGFYGISRSGRLDIGIQARYLRNRIDNAATSSMFKVFEGENDAALGESLSTAILDNSFGGLGFLGLRFRAILVESIPELVINGGYLFSTVNDELKQNILRADRDFAELGLTYYKELTPTTYYFFSANANAFFSSPITDFNSYITSGSFFLIQRTANQRFTFYPGLTYSLAFKPSQLDNNPSLIKESEFLLAFAGIQYAPNSNYNFFLVGGFPLIGETTNPRQEIVRPSYSTISLGLRFGIY